MIDGAEWIRTILAWMFDAVHPGRVPAADWLHGAWLHGAWLHASAQDSLVDRTLAWPDWNQWRRVLLLQDFNTRVVLAGTSLLGLAAGTIGSFTLLRKRALMGDALSHATLPGIALAFILSTLLGGTGKSLPVLLAGAAATGVIGMGTILLIRRYSRIKEDAALGIVLSVFFGAGVSLLKIAEQVEGGHAAGLETFIYGKTASMLPDDARLIAATSLIVIAACGLMFTPFKLLCFDQAYAGSRGLPVFQLDAGMMSLVVLVTIVGLQAVGLVLMIALLVIPAASARFWTDRMGQMTWISALLGGAGGTIGAAASALLPNLPSGAMIVVVATCFFLMSLCCGPARGLLPRLVRRRRLNARVQAEHLLRAIHEQLELSGRLPPRNATEHSPTVPWQALLHARSWSGRQLQRAVARARRGQLAIRPADGGVRLSPRGLIEAARLVRQHRLWEMYLITHADIAPSHVDRDADLIEHVLEPQMIAHLEELWEQQQAATVRRGSVPVESPHPIASEAANHPPTADG